MAEVNRHISLREQLGLILPEELAETLGVSVATLTEWRKSRSKHGPPFVTRGRRVYYRLEDVDAWINTVGEHDGSP